MTKAAGIPDSYFGNRGQLYYFDDEHASAKKWVENKKKEYDADFAILVNLSGSSLHKKFVQAENVSRAIFGKYPKALVVLTGDKDCKPQEFLGDRIFSKVDKWNFRTTALQCKYFDLTISLETGLALIAHSWDAPCLQLLTAASWANHVKYAKNAYWLQAPVACSPCHRNPREYYGCPVKDKLPACVYFNEDAVMEKVEEALSERHAMSA